MKIYSRSSSLQRTDITQQEQKPKKNKKPKYKSLVLESFHDYYKKVKKEQIIGTSIIMDNNDCTSRGIIIDAKKRRETKKEYATLEIAC